MGETKLNSKSNQGSGAYPNYVIGRYANYTLTPSGDLYITFVNPSELRMRGVALPESTPTIDTDLIALTVPAGVADAFLFESYLANVRLNTNRKLRNTSS